MKVLGKLSRDNDGLKWEKEKREMNTIEHEGKTYEVLDGWSRLPTHAKLATGIKKVGYMPIGITIDGDEYTMKQINDNGIQPLRLVPKEPVTFEGRAVRTLQGDVCIWVPHEVEGKPFRCVEIMEEA
jgi:hypothetical protein